MEIPSHLLDKWGGGFADPCFLVKIQTDNPYLLHSRNGSITANGEVYSSGAVVTALAENVGGGQSAAVKIHNSDLTKTVDFQSCQGARVDIWIADGEGPFSSDDLAHPFTGIIDSVSGVGSEINISLSSDGRLNSFAPRYTIAEFFDYYHSTTDNRIGQELIPITMGSDRLTGIRTLYGVNNNKLVVRYVWGVGLTDVSTRIESITNIRINGDAVPVNTEVYHYYGDAAQGVSTAFGFLTGHADNGRRIKNGVPIAVAYSDFVFNKGDVNGLPTCTAEIKGLRIDGAYTDKPANMTSALIRSNVIGQGRSVTGVSDVLAANNESVGGNPRRSVGITLDTAKTVMDWTERLGDLSGAFLIGHAGSVQMIPDRPVIDIPTIKNIKQNSVKYIPADQRAIPSAVICNYTDATEIPWRSASTRVTDAPVTGGIGSPLYLNNPEIHDSAQAIRAAQDKAVRLQKTIALVQWEGFPDSLQYKRSDVVKINSRHYTGNVRLSLVTAQSNGFVRMEGVVYTGSYSDNTETITHPPVSTLPDTNSISTPLSMTVTAGDAERSSASDGTVTYGFKVKFTPNTSDDWLFFKQYGCEYSRPGETDRISVSIDESGVGLITGVEDGQTYTVYGWAVNYSDAKSSELQQTVTPITKDIDPPAPSNVSGSGKSDGSRTVTISQPTLPDDYAGTDIRLSNGTMLESRVDTRENRTITINQIPTGSQTIEARNYDRTGNYSGWTSSGSVNFGSDQAAVKSAQDQAAADAQAKADSVQNDLITTNTNVTNTNTQLATTNSNLVATNSKAIQAIADASAANSQAITATAAATTPNGDYFSQVYYPMVNATSSASAAAGSASTDAANAMTEAESAASAAFLADGKAVTAQARADYAVSEIGGTWTEINYIKSKWISVDNLAAQTIYGDQVNATNLAAINSTLGTVNSGLVQHGGDYLSMTASNRRLQLGSFVCNTNGSYGKTFSASGVNYTNIVYSAGSGQAHFGDAHRLHINPYKTYVYGSGYSGTPFWVDGSTYSWLQTQIDNRLRELGLIT